MLFQDQSYQEGLYKRALGKNKLRKIYMESFSDSRFHIFNRVYGFTNEALEGIFEEVDHNKKKVLGIMGCGDYLISSLKQEPTKFVGVDTSIFASFLTELKIAALKTFDYSTFLDFYGLDKKYHGFQSGDSLPEKFEEQNLQYDCFSMNRYKQIRPLLTETAKIFLDGVIGHSFENLNYYKVPLILHYSFNEITRPELKEIHFLRSKKDYESTQQQLQNSRTQVELLNMNLNDITSIDDYFDIIYLSNIMDHIGDDERVFLLNTVTQRLNSNGQIIVAQGIHDIPHHLEDRGFKYKSIRGYKGKNNSPYLIDNALIIHHEE